MSDTIDPNTNRPSTHAGALVTLALGFAFVAACFPVQNFDVWWHLKTGELTAANGWPATTDPYSFASGGARWVNSGWLTQVGMYALFSAFGFSGLVAAKALIVAAIALVLWLGCRGRGASATAFACVVVCAVLAARFRFRVRPAIVSGLLFAVFLWLLDRHERTRTRCVWLLAPLMLLWANAHPGFPAGFIVLVLYWLSAAWRGRRLSAFVRPTPLRTLTLAGLACAAAALVNPFGWRPFLYALRLTASHAFMQDIGEWAAPALDRFYAPFWAYLGGGALCVALTRRRLTLSDGLVLAVLGGMAATTQRHVFLFAIASAPIFAKHLHLLAQALRNRWPALARPAAAKLAAAVPAVAMLVAAVGFVQDERNFPFGFGLRPGLLPVNAVDFIEQHALPNNVANAYRWGGYLEWRCFPKRQVYIDGRCLVYGDKVYLEWKRAVHGEPGWEDTFARRDVNTLLLGHDVALPILHSPDWRVVYWDDISVVLVRRTSATEDIIRRFACDLSLPTLFESHWADAPTRPKLVAAFERQVKRQPDCVTARVCLARCRGLLGKADEAVRELAKARELAPHSSAVLNELAFWLAAAKRPREAAKVYQALLRLNPRHAVAHYGLAECRRALGDPKQAERELRKALRLRPDFLAARRRLIELLRQQGKMQQADEQAARLNALSQPK